MSLLSLLKDEAVTRGLLDAAAAAAFYLVRDVPYIREWRGTL
jgi:hypothetical protein